MSHLGIVRVRYFDHQLLRRQEMSDEQEYHLSLRRRHNLGAHRWGIVHGLELRAADQTLSVSPGWAIDGYGRDVLLARWVPLPATLFQDKDADALDVWAVWDRQAVDLMPEGNVCTNGDEPFTRWREEARISVRAAGATLPDARRPSEVPPEDWSFSPERNPPDDPQWAWPVYLGRIKITEADGVTGFLVDLTGRPYAGLVGSDVVHPEDERHRIELDGTGGGADCRFAVFVGSDGEEGQPPRPRLEATGDGEVKVLGRTTVEGGVTLSGSLDFRDGAACAEEPRPWQVYLHESEAGERELRLEIEAGGEGLENRAVLGAWSEEEEAFAPLLTVSDRGSVAVHGDLYVSGKVLPGAKTEGSEVGEEVQSFLVSNFMSGLASAEALLTLGGDEADQALLEAMAGRLAESPKQAKAFAKLVCDQFPDLARLLSQHLRPESE